MNKRLEKEKKMINERNAKIATLKKELRFLKKEYKIIKSAMLADEIRRVESELKEMGVNIKRPSRMKIDTVKKTLPDGSVASVEYTITPKIKKVSSKALNGLTGMEILKELMNVHKNIRYENGYLYIKLSGYYFKFKYKLVSIKKYDNNNYSVTLKNGVTFKLYVSNKKLIIDNNAHEYLIKSNKKFVGNPMHA